MEESEMICDTWWWWWRYGDRGIVVSFESNAKVFVTPVSSVSGTELSYGREYCSLKISYAVDD